MTTELVTGIALNSLFLFTVDLDERSRGSFSFNAPVNDDVVEDDNAVDGVDCNVIALDAGIVSGLVTEDICC